MKHMDDYPKYSQCDRFNKMAEVKERRARQLREVCLFTGEHPAVSLELEARDLRQMAVNLLKE